MRYVLERKPGVQKRSERKPSACGLSLCSEKEQRHLFGVSPLTQHATARTRSISDPFAPANVPFTSKFLWFVCFEKLEEFSSRGFVYLSGVPLYFHQKSFAEVNFGSSVPSHAAQLSFCSLPSTKALNKTSPACRPPPPRPPLLPPRLRAAARDAHRAAAVRGPGRRSGCGGRGAGGGAEGAGGEGAELAALQSEAPSTGGGGGRVWTGVHDEWRFFLFFFSLSAFEGIAV